jgi:hypothetical protein
LHFRIFDEKKSKKVHQFLVSVSIVFVRLPYIGRYLDIVSVSEIGKVYPGKNRIILDNY